MIFIGLLLLLLLLRRLQGISATAILCRARNMRTNMLCFDGASSGLFLASACVHKRPNVDLLASTKEQSAASAAVL